MKITNVKYTGGDYNIYVGEDILAESLATVLEISDFDRLFLVTDSNVRIYCAPYFHEALSSCGRTLAGEFVFAAGETSKTLETVSDMYTAFAGAGLTRKSLVIALGGGVCGDMAGFAAATFLRGISVLQIPTTLLSQVDSSIGGKTGVDLSIGKNLVGAFKQPVAVISDSRFLKTLPRRYMNDGMGEVIKYGCIADAELFDGVMNNTVDMAEIIYRCSFIKAKIVEEDELETGIRAILNYGHTLGHAVERLGDFKRFSHGEAVGIGMLYAARIGAKLGYDSTFEDKIRKALVKWELPTDMDYTKEALLSIVNTDKKRTADEIKFILLDRIGNAIIKQLPISEIGDLI